MFYCFGFSTSGFVDPYKNLYNYMSRSCKKTIKTIIICQGAKVVSKLAYKNYNYMPRCQGRVQISL